MSTYTLSFMKISIIGFDCSSHESTLLFLENGFFIPIILHGREFYSRIVVKNVEICGVFYWKIYFSRLMK